MREFCKALAIATAAALLLTGLLFVVLSWPLVGVGVVGLVCWLPWTDADLGRRYYR